MNSARETALDYNLNTQRGTFRTFRLIGNDDGKASAGANDASELPAKPTVQVQYVQHVETVFQEK